MSIFKSKKPVQKDPIPFYMRVIADLHLESSPNAAKAKFKSAVVSLHGSPNVQMHRYFTKEGPPNHDGYKATANVLVQGILANIHTAHQDGLWDSAEQLRWVIDNLERGFVQNVTVEHGEKKAGL